ncbi:hypothetical protein KG112_07765 [Nocardioides sp. zg-ZUI104]|uniref:hypothetical protein n=1 Tax=Nocardioides faecalis TaxID=2803858 RepID=UPI001BD1654B|nr:hypothetical protein [Nocardioides faecalis]MBS4752704.1 hypothetical protein [Nocardioides faecalis]
MSQERRRWPQVGAVGVLLAGLIGGTAATAEAAPRPVVASVDAIVGTDRAVVVAVRCTKAARCQGKVKLTVAGAGTRAKAYRVKRGKATKVRIVLTAAQYRKVAAKKRITTVRVSAAGRQVVKRKVVLRAARPALRVRGTEVDVAADHVAQVSVACGSAAVRCTGSATLRIAGKAGAARPVRVAAKGVATLRFPLTSAQISALGTDGGWVGGQVRLTETTPERVASGTAVRLRMHGEGHDHGGSEGESAAYARGWTPTQYDTCTRAEHNSYAATGPDGKLYPSWHPPVHTRADGSTCTFGHEHGDDPTSSDIYEWAIEQFRAENPEAEGIPFGYGSEMLSEYSEIYGGGVHRHEDDPGQKVVVSNDQQMGVDFVDRYGDTQPLVCDHLIKAHQGSHSGDATKNNTHELFYALACNDGTKLHTYLMSNYGNANELHASCTRPFTAEHPEARAVQTIGSVLPDGEGGSRIIPTADCVEQYLKNGTENGTDTVDDRRGSPAASANSWWWAGYEQWQSFNSITDAEGKEIARFEPWFGLQNPSRYYVGNGATDTQVAYFNDLAWQSGNQQSWAPWRTQASGSATLIDRKSPKAWFNGAIRDAWITTTKVDNAEADTAVVYADPWGKNAKSTRSPASIRTYISRTDNTRYVTRTTPSVTNRSTRQHEGLQRKGATAPATLGFFYDYGTDAQGNSLGVHAPN